MIRLSRALALFAVGVFFIAACGGTSSTGTTTTFKGTKKVGLSIALSGQSNLYGHAISQSLRLTADDINAKGGVNGYKIEMDILDDATTVDKAVANTQQLILQDQVVALIGSVTSSQCAAETPVARQNKIITIAATCNSYQLTLEPDLVSPYWVSIVPNTYMEGTSAGQLAAKLGAKKIFIVSPKYLFGTSETNAFVASLKKQNANVTFNDQATWYVPFPTNPRWDSTINAIQAFHPDLVYSNIFSQDQVNFIKQALAVDPQFFTKYPMETLSSIDDFNALGAQYPQGMHVYMRAPFFARLGDGGQQGRLLRLRQGHERNPREVFCQPARLHLHHPRPGSPGERRRDDRDHHRQRWEVSVRDAQGPHQPEGGRHPDVDDPHAGDAGR